MTVRNAQCNEEDYQKTIHACLALHISYHDPLMKKKTCTPLFWAITWLPTKSKKALLRLGSIDNYNLRASLSPVQSSSLLTGTDLGVAKYFWTEKIKVCFHIWQPYDIYQICERSLSAELTRVGENVLHYSAQTRNFPLPDATFALEVTYQKEVSPATPRTC